MKNLKLSCLNQRKIATAIACGAALGACTFLCGTLLAADTAPIPIDAIENPLDPLLAGLSGKYGWLTTVVLVIGSLRIIFKPVMLAIENYVRQTPGAEDDARLAKFEAGPVYKAIAFLLDFGASIKLPSRTKE